jgi:D-lactate dehydrogenase
MENIMHKIAFYDTKPYDRTWFEKQNPGYEIRWLETRLTAETTALAADCAAVCVFVHDEVNREVLAALKSQGVSVVALRCAGYNNVDLRAAGELGIAVVRVPAYSPYAVAEHALALLLSLDRHIHRAYTRTRDFNFSLTGLTGVDLHGRTAGVVGMGRIGRVFADICWGLGMRVIAYDLFPGEHPGVQFVSKETLFRQADVISLHCPLTPETRDILNADAFAVMKPGVFIINTSRGELIDSLALLDALRSGKVRGAGLDVYEEEEAVFYEDKSNETDRDTVLALLTTHPSVIVTSHQAFLTEEALYNIASTTYYNLGDCFAGRECGNAVTAPDEIIASVK